MASPRILKVVNYRKADIGALEALEAILKREGKEYTEWVREETVAYVKAHGSGNPVYRLDDFSDGKMIALPTPWQDPTKEFVRGLSKEDKKFMVAQMAKWYKAIQ